MAKFAVILLAALAFQATFAGVVRHQETELNEHYNQLHAAVKDLSEYLHTTFPNTRESAKIISWECHRLAEAVQDIINRVEKESHSYEAFDGDFQNFLNELQEIYSSLRQISVRTNVNNVNEVKEQFITNLRNIYEQIERLVNYVYSEHQGNWYVIVKNIVAEFMMTVQQTRAKIVDYKEQVPTMYHQNPEKMVKQIQEVTHELVQYLYREYYSQEQVQTVLYSYAKHIQLLIRKLQGEQTLGDEHFDVVMHKITNKLREVQSYIYRIDTENTADFKEIRYQIATYFREIATTFEQFVHYNFGHFESSYFVEQIINEYYYAIHQVYEQFRTNFEYFYGKQFQGKYYYPRAFRGYEQNFDTENVAVYGSLAPYQQEKLTLEFQRIVADLFNVLETVYLDNTYVRQSFFTLVREYIQHVETIYEKLEQVNEFNVDVQELKETIIAFRQLINNDAIFNTVELKRELVIYVEKIARQMYKFTTYMHENKNIKMAFFEYFIATRNMLMKIHIISGIVAHGQTANDFEIPIQALVNGLTGAFHSITFDNKQAKEIFLQQYKEFAINLKTIVEKMEVLTFKQQYTNKAFQQVLINLQQIVTSFERFSNFDDVTIFEQMRMHFIMSMQDAATEILKLLWVGEHFDQQEVFVTGIINGIFNDFIGILQNQHIQLQNIYFTKQHGRGAYEMAIQIQAITNNAALFLQNIPSNNMLLKQKLEVEARKFAGRVAHLVERLEVFPTYITEQDFTEFDEIVNRLKHVAVKFERLNEFDTYGTIYDLASDFHFLLQNVATEMKRLAWFVEHRMPFQTQKYFANPIKSMFMEYMVVIQNVQIKIQRINQIVQVGESPKELALQLAVVSRHVTELLHVIGTDSEITQYSLIWQARRFQQLLDIIVNRLNYEVTTSDEKIDVLLQQVAQKLKTIYMQLQRILIDQTATTPYEFQMQFIAAIRISSMEIQKLMWVAQTDLQQGQGIKTTYLRGILFDYLMGLQHLNVQLQNNYQLIYTRQNPNTLAMQIQSVAQRLVTVFQYVHPNQVHFKETIVIQIGEFTQTIENIIRLLQTEVKYNPSKTVMVKEICEKLSQISLYFQQLAEVKTADIHDVAQKLALNIERVVYEVQKLGAIVEYQYEQAMVGAQTRTFNSVYNSLLACLRNMYMQVRITYQFGEYKYTVDELAGHIQTINNNMLHAIQNIVGNTKQVKQAINIQAIKYAHHLQHIVERFEMYVTYDKVMNVESLQEIKENLKETIYAIHQIATSATTLTVNDLELQFNTQIQNVAAQMQKLMLVQITAIKTENYAIRTILLEYLATIQNLYVQMQNIARMSYEGDNLQLIVMQTEATVLEISNTFPWLFQHYRPTYQVVEQAIVMEAHEMAKMITNIVSRFQSVAALKHNVVLQQIASELKDFQLFLVQFSEEKVSYNKQQIAIEFIVRLQRATHAIGKLMWIVPNYEQHMEFKPDMPTFSRVALYDFLASVQNMYIQIYNAVHLKGHQVEQYEQLPYPIYKYEQSYENPKEYMIQIQKALDDFYIMLQHSTVYDQGTKQTVIMTVRNLRDFIDTVVYQLQEQMGQDTKVNYKVNQVVYKMREIQVYLKKMTEYTTFTNFAQFKIEFYSQVQAIVEQLQQLHHIAYELPENHWTFTIRNVLKNFYYTLYEMREYNAKMPNYGYEQIFQGKLYRYNKDYQTAMNQYGYDQLFNKYGKTYKYNKDYQTAMNQYEYDQLFNKYGKTYKYNNDYQTAMNQYGYDQLFNKYGKTYKYNKDYQTAMNQYEYDQLFNKYGKTYKYNKDYQTAMNQYEYDHLFNKYGKTYKYNKDYQTAMNHYGYDQLFNKYGKTYKYNKDYQTAMNQYGYDHLFNKYGKTYKYNKDYQTAMNQYGYDQLFNKYGKTYKYNKDYQTAMNQYGYDQLFNKYGKTYTYNKDYQTAMNEYGYDQLFNKYGKTYKYNKDYQTAMNQYGYDQLFNKYGKTYKYNKDYQTAMNQYGYDQLFNKYGKTYKYNKDYQTAMNQYGYDQLFSEYGYDRYSKTYDQTMQYRYQGQTPKQVAVHMQAFAKYVVGKLQTKLTDNQQTKQTTVYYARQLVQVIEYIMAKIQKDMNNDMFVQQVYYDLKQIHQQLYKMVTYGHFVSIYQLRTEFFKYIEVLTKQLYKLAIYEGRQYQTYENEIVKDIMMQYVTYLHQVYQQIYTYGYIDVEATPFRSVDVLTYNKVNFPSAFFKKFDL